MMNFIEYLSKNYPDILFALSKHIQLTFIAIFFSIIIGVPLGIFISYAKKLTKPVLGLANIFQSIPSMAIFGFIIPFLGTGSVPAVTVVILYSLLPIIKNTFTGMNSINAQTLEAAQGIGLTKMQILLKIQLPLALPVIMTGVRISAVTAVGLMTIGAFIGAGGLGLLVFAGIRTLDNNQILAGAIPACLLALTIDYYGSIIESLLTPISLIKGFSSNKSKLLKKRKLYKMLVVLFTGLIILASFGGSFASKSKPKSAIEKVADKKIVIGTIDFSENLVLGHMIADLIEYNTDIHVERKLSLGNSGICFEALKAHSIDLFVEYTGTMYMNVLKHPVNSDSEEVYNISKEEYKEKYNIDVLKQLGFNNTYAVAIRKDTAEEFNIKTISDFAKYAGDFNMGVTFSFMQRADGLPQLKEAYGFVPKSVQGLDGSSRYLALDNKNIDATDAYSTDGILSKYTVLKDDKHFFPPYYAVPIVDGEILDKYPEIVPEIDKISGILSEDVMIILNYKVDVDHEKPEDVARNFLLEKGLIKE